MAKQLEWDSWWTEQIVQSLAGIRFGSVQIVIHEGKIVQIERTEKRRFDEPTVVRDSSSSRKK